MLIEQEARFGFPGNVEVVLAHDSNDALIRMSEHVPSVVIVDIQTGSAGGFALAKEMKQTLGLERVPVFILLEREHDRWLARQAGASEVAIKPIDASDLFRRALALVA